MPSLVGRLTRLRPRATPEGSQIVLLVATACHIGLALGLTVLLGRYLAAAEFGFFALVGTVFTVAHELTDLGTNNLAVRDSAQAPERERRTLEMLFGLRLGLSGIAASLCLVLVLTQASLAHRAILLVAAAILPFGCVSALNAVFQRRQRLLMPALLNVAAQLMMVVAGIALVRLDAAAIWFALLLPGREVVVIVGTRQLAIRLLGYSPRPRLGREAIRSFLGKAAIVAGATLFYEFQFQGGVLFVEVLRPTAELGAFAAASRPLIPLFLVSWLVVVPLVPLLSWLAVTRPDAFRRQSEATLQLCVGIGAVIAVAAMQTAPALLDLLYAGKFSDGPLSAVATLRWLALPLGCSLVISASAAILLAAQHERALFRLSLAALVLYLGANLILLPYCGFAGAALANAVATAATMLGGLGLLLSKVGIGLGRRTGAVLLPAAALYGLLQFSAGPPLLQLAVAGLLSGLALAAVWYFPGAADMRAEQARLSDLALMDDAAGTASGKAYD